MDKDKKISQLVGVDSLTGEETVPFARNGANGSFKMRVVLNKIPKRSDLLYVPTLSAVPDGTVTSYTDSSGATVQFTIGQFCRVENVDSEQGYTFYQLYDITTDGKAVWAQGGGGVDLREKVRISLVSNLPQPDASLIGATVVVMDTTIGGEVLNTTWQGQELLAKVTALSAYTVTVGDVEGYITPTAQSYNASIQGDRSVTMSYEMVMKNYITINQNITDPDTRITGDINGEITQVLQSRSHCVLGKLTEPGVMTYCRLDDTDRTKFHDGSTAALDGTHGDVFTLIPEFYYHAEEISDEVWKVGFGLYISDATWKHSPAFLLGTYEAYRSGSKAYSHSGVYSTGDVSQAWWKESAAARGTGYQIEDWSMHNIMAFLFYFRYGKMNCQAVVGAGTSYVDKKTGMTDNLGMTDTVAGGNGDSGSINFWGVENWWGNKYECIDRIVWNKGVATIIMPDGSTRTLQGYDVEGSYPTKMVIGEYLDLVAKDTAGSSTTGYCDYYKISTSDTGILVNRSNGYSNQSGGVAYIEENRDPLSSSMSIGSRLAFRGTLLEAESVEAFKAIAVTN